MHHSVNGRPLPDARNTSLAWAPKPQTHYIKMLDGRLFYVRRVEAADIQALTTKTDCLYLIIYAARAAELTTHRGVLKCLAFVRDGAIRQLERLERNETKQNAEAA